MFKRDFVHQFDLLKVNKRVIAIWIPPFIYFLFVYFHLFKNKFNYRTGNSCSDVVHSWIICTILSIAMCGHAKETRRVIITTSHPRFIVFCKESPCRTTHCTSAGGSLPTPTNSYFPINWCVVTWVKTMPEGMDWDAYPVFTIISMDFTHLLSLARSSFSLVVPCISVMILSFYYNNYYINITAQEFLSVMMSIISIESYCGLSGTDVYPSSSNGERSEK